MPEENLSTKAPQHRWRPRPLLNLALRFLIFAAPVFAASATSAIVAGVLPPPQGAPATVLWWFALIGSSLVVLILMNRFARRLLPLTVLLSLSMAFPSTPPSRLKMATRAGRVRDLRSKVQEAQAHGLHDQPTLAAETILTLLAALAVHDRQTRGHSERVRVLVDLIAQEMAISQKDRDLLRWAAILHDIGKLSVPHEILHKEGSPNEHEWEVLHEHPIEGARMIAPLAPWLGKWGGTVEHHHEKFDGTGYPHGLKGEAISLGGRIVAVADSFETMTAVRPYKQPMSVAVAREELASQAGRHFDPKVVRAFLNVVLGTLWRRVGVISWFATLPLLAKPAWAMRQFGAQVGAGTAAAVAVVAVGVTLVPVSQPRMPPVVSAPSIEERVQVPPQLLPVESPTAETVIQSAAQASEGPATAGVAKSSEETNVEGDVTPAPETTPSPTPTKTYRNHGECVSSVAQEQSQPGDSGVRDNAQGQNCA